MKVNCYLGHGLWETRGHWRATEIPGAKHNRTGENLSESVFEDPVIWNLHIMFVSLLRVADHSKITLYVGRCTTSSRTNTLPLQWSFYTGEVSPKSLPNSGFE